MELDTANTLRRHSADAGVKENLRDISDLTPLLKPGMVFRSSFMHSMSTRKRHDITAVLDLRRSSRLCKKQSRVMKEMTRPDWMWIRLRTAGMQAAGFAVVPSCPNCQAQLSDEDTEFSTKVFHVDMCTPGFKLKVFGAVPRQSQFKAIRRALTLRDPEETISSAVADPDTFGYGRLYILFLEHSKAQIAKIFSVLSNKDNYPLLIHCIHGKDRTGLAVMLLLRVCGVDYDTILKDYMVSQRTMVSWHARGDVPLKKHLTSQQILSVERAYMEQAIDHIRIRYGDVPQYLESCGVSAEQQQIAREINSRDGGGSAAERAEPAAIAAAPAAVAAAEVPVEVPVEA
eukprot:jgi/Ulvmu1/10307/UM060_0109.1